jgi:uncharacterized membrane protein
MTDTALLGIGNRIAPARFVFFVLVFAIAAPVGLWLAWDDCPRGLMGAFDLAASLFLLSCVPFLMVDEPDKMRDDARRNDAGRLVLLVFTGIVLTAVVAAIAAEVAETGALDWQRKAWVIGTLLLAWLFGNTVYTLHYAHLAYQRGGGDKCGGIHFPPGTEEPVYADFAYFAFTLGMTFQTSDVEIRDPAIRRTVTVHCLAAFFFNIGVLAFTINVLGR